MDKKQGGFNWAKYRDKSANSVQKPKKFDWGSHVEEPEDTTGMSGILGDVGNSFSSLPEELKSMVLNIPGQAYESGKQILTHPIRATENVGAGLLEGLKGLVNTPSNVASYLGEKDIGRGSVEDFIKKLHIGDTGLQQTVLGENQPGDELLQGLGSFAPYARLGGMARGLGGAAKRAGAAGLYGAGQNQDPLLASLLGLTTEGVTSGAKRLMKPGTFLPHSPLSDEELINSANVTKGTETNLGNVLENPFLQQQYENVLSKLPLSGANQAAQRTAATITSRGEDILSKLKGGLESDDIGGALQGALKEAEQQTRNTKNAKFDKLNEAAESMGLTTNRSNLRTEANEILEQINSDPDLAHLTDSKVKSLLQKLSRREKEGEISAIPENAQDQAKLLVNKITKLKEGEKVGQGYSLKNTDFLRGELGEKAHDAYMSNDSKLSGILTRLKRASEKDINHAIDASGNDKLLDLRKDAMDFYKNHYAPFEEPEIRKFTKIGGDPDLIANAFLKTSKVADRSRLLEKMTNKLSRENNDLLAYSYFSRALKDGVLDPLKIKTLYKGLGDRQRRALLSKPMEDQLRNYTQLVGKNTDALNIMFNPKTGQRGLSELPYKSIGTAALTALGSGSVPVGILTALAPGVLSRPIVKALSSPVFREKIIQKIIGAREKNVGYMPKNLEPLINALTQASQTHKPMEIEVTKGYR